MAKRSTAIVTTATPVQTTPAPTASTPAPTPTPRSATHHRKAAAKRKHRTDPPKQAHRRPVALHAPSLPKLDPTRLVAPPTHADDAGRARKLAAGALSLLILSLASAMLLAVVARGDRRRVVR